MRRAAVAALALLALLGAGGCAIFQVELPAQQPADELLDVDRLFARRAQSDAPQAYRQFFEAQGIWLEPAGQPVVGREPIAAQAAQRRAGQLSWEPRFAEVPGAGDWGWTWGDWALHEPGSTRRIANGRYMTVWKRQPDNTWQVRATLVGSTAR